MSGEGDPDAKPTVVDRPPSTPHAVGTQQPVNEPSRRPSRKRSIPPGARYESGAEIGRGGMGRVVEATDTLLDRRVAVKEALTTDAELLRRFARETKITARLEHPSIVPVYDAGVVDGSPFYVMRRVTGRPLSELIRAAPTLEERLALVPHLLAAAQAIAHAHQRGIIHRDVKPANILVGDLGETVVIDWGLAKVIGEPDDDSSDDKEPDASSSLRTRMGVVFGTPGFMDPNQLRGDFVGPQGDVYSLGASLYNLLAAEPPHYSNDSTQMMKLAAQGPPTPIGQLVPGVPAELSTIVDTATDYDTARRYQDAGAFAEELKRFLAGQLVASHRYSRTERFLRFVRKHRAAVAIGTAATILVVFIGAFALSQVLEERDRADEQARLATQGRREAEAARAMADERAEQLLISRASALVETNPTAALASLKQLSPRSQHLAEARSIISSAKLRGVSWAMKAADAQTAFAVLDQSGRHLAQMTVDGVMHVYDLDARRLVFEKHVERGTQLRWILGGKFLLAAGNEATRMFDPSGVEHPSNLPGLVELEVDAAGTMLLAVDKARRASRIDLETRKQVHLLDGAGMIAISDDGTHCAVVTDDNFQLFDASNTAILRRPHKHTLTRVVMSQAKIAVLDDGKIFQARFGAGPTWKELVLPTAGQNKPYWLDYNNERLFAAFTDARLVAEWQGALAEIGRMESTSGGMSKFGEHYLVVGSDGRRIFYVDGARMRSFYLPISLRYVRIVARATQPRIVALGDGAIVVLDLEWLPKLIQTDRYQSNVFVGKHSLVSLNGISFDFSWFDLRTSKATAVAAAGPLDLRSFDRDSGRLLFAEVMQEGRRITTYKVGETLPADVIDAPFEQVQLVGDGVAYSKGSKVFGGYAGRTRPELFTTNGTARIIVRISSTRFAVVADHELVRGDLRSSAIERVALPDGLKVSFASAHDRDVVIARGTKILRWRATLEELATLEADIDYLVPTPHGLLALLTNHSAIFIDRGGKQTRLASTRGGVLVADNRVIVPGQFQYDIIELPSFARWALPITRISDMADVQLDISPDGTQLVEKAFDGRLWLWQLPTSDNFADAVNATNLYEDPNGLLLWPWQAPDPKK
ncbi:MAG: serine/threonine protein kinase [Myxococcota bacterium]|nr:serine/threonine protein kinase [Myxococcota bacterium]